MNALKDLFLDELTDRYGAEKRLARALPKLAKAATCQHLRTLFQTHLQETIGHVKTLEAVFKSFGAKIKPGNCAATLGLLLEGDEIVACFRGTTAINAALISVAQKHEHYEIASYGSLHEWAALLGNQEAAGWLKAILAEEKAANLALGALARNRGNREALGGDPAGAPGLDDQANQIPKPPTGRRGMRPLNFNPAHPVLI